MTQQETKAVEDAAKKLNWLEMNAFIKGAQFLDELRKPSERPNIKDFFPTDAQISDVRDEITSAPRLYAYMQSLDSYIDSLWENPSEPETNVCEAGEELVEKIELILNENRETDILNRTALDWRNFHSVATEIAALMQNRQENVFKPC